MAALWGYAWSWCNEVSPFFAGPGISGYSHDTENAGHSLVQCLRQAQGVIPSKQHQETPVYLGATAGMRLLRYCRALPLPLHLGPSWMFPGGLWGELVGSLWGEVLGNATSSHFAQISPSAAGLSGHMGRMLRHPPQPSIQ